MKSEIEIAKGKSIGQSYESIEGVMTGAQLQAMKETVENIFIHDRIYEYMMALIHATRKNPYIELGVSPRGMVALTKMVRANAFLNERDYVIPATSVSRHFPSDSGLPLQEMVSEPDD